MEEKRTTAFGSYLKTVRLEKGIKLSTISEQTRISKDTLAALEDEDHSRLPAEVFVKGFIRAYARVVGADGDVAVKGFVASCRLLGDSPPPRTDLTGGEPPTRGRWPLFLGILILIVIAGVWSWRSMSAVISKEQTTAPPSAESPVSQPAGPEEPEPPVAATPATPPAVPASLETKATPVDQTPPAAAPAAPPETQPAEQAVAQPRQRIQILVIEETWLKVITDSLTTTEYSLGPGDTLELEADLGFNLLIGNATGIELTYNDEPVPITGKSGQVVPLQLP